MAATSTRYPLSVALPGGRVRHDARLVRGGPRVTTSCRKTGEPSGDGAGLPYCAACARHPNPIRQQTSASSG